MKNFKNALLLKNLYQHKQLGYRYTSLLPYQEEEPDFTLSNTLETLEKQAHNCHLCSLSTHRDKIVFGDGLSKAKLMIIGDIPSHSDNSKGKIFTDRAGDSLQKMIENVLELRRDEVYLSNLLKCHPIDGQDISPAHTHTCYPYLQKEIEIIAPKIIIALGELVYQYLTEDKNLATMETLHGTVYQKDKIMIIPTYHPAYLLRNPDKKKVVFEDLKKIKVYIDNF